LSVDSTAFILAIDDVINDVALATYFNMFYTVDVAIAYTRTA
jgi:hypothetical protein